MLTDAHKTERMASALILLERYHKDGDEFLNHIVRVTGDKIWVSLSSGCIHIHQTCGKSFNKRLAES
jgi:hypothetical protein